MPRSRKAFHFDLSVKELEANGAPKDAWTKIGRFLERNGFEHIQGSGYESRHTMSHQDVNLILEQMQDWQESRCPVASETVCFRPAF